MKKYRKTETTEKVLFYRILNNPSGYVNTVQLVVMVINLIIGRWYLEYLGSLLQDGLDTEVFPVRFAAEMLAGVILVYAVMTIGVLLPKRLASKKNPEKWAYACMGMINMILTLFYPMVRLISDTTSGILHLMGIRDESAEADVTEGRNRVRWLPKGRNRVYCRILKQI